MNPIVGLDITLIDHMNQELIVVLFELSGWLFILVVCLFKIVMHNATYFVNSIFWQCDIQWRYFLFPPNEATPLIKRVSTKRYATYQPTVFLSFHCNCVPFWLSTLTTCKVVYPFGPKLHNQCFQAFSTYNIHNLWDFVPSYSQGP